MPAVTKIIFSAFDAGGGNAVFPVVKKLSHNSAFSCLCFIGGPSKAIFKEGNIPYIDADKSSIKKLKSLAASFKPQVFVSGTSRALTFDKKLLDTVRSVGAKTIYILDYWANYWQRFSGAKRDFRYLSDLICVMDAKAKRAMIADGFSSKIIRATGNPHFDSFLKNTNGKREEKGTILFVSTPVVKKQEAGFDEHRVLESILQVLREGNFPGHIRVIIRPHPKEKIGKFDRYVGPNVLVDSKSAIEALLSSAGLVIGITSGILFQAFVSGKKVISYQPDLKARDFSIYGMFGFGTSAKKEKELKVLLEKYFSGKFPVSRKSKNILTPHATENVVALIEDFVRVKK